MQAGYVADKSLGYAQSGVVDASTLINSLTFGTGATAGIPSGTHTILITPQAQAIRWRDDGGVPTAAVGYPVAVGAELRYTGSNLANLRVIGQAASAIVNCVAYGSGV